jgi:hypothetical protein
VNSFGGPVSLLAHCDGGSFVDEAGGREVTGKIMQAAFHDLLPCLLLLSLRLQPFFHCWNDVVSIHVSI